ncbi:MAG: 4-hydroxythreonine-4-phosphate dehydrogenase PdxA [Paludibacteraceae bacterium]|nr:4-hydroxythreonine-4-phosphate dehydrogenase PdxA [Paludibacteraceae bacterium]MBQ1752133.1 4-hydroxythreonine-4-phosphate dehydrogenase PdxA [Paludibacteraceae bacterium]MBQ1851531.1 4-hydroxythreonine-4-phosphate dehydrogenase PdxA [Paludibacteraceae bacterium]MBQ2065368.1 4-hydroxythreonine-4-phosphate dehydrogenase PdxA [Paludibacteraceae bacterium]MBQ4032882.1 4-hydroxythreonine-4-phosphate dehydrogenase PdxA [Paludibacteraceae bacterium]
MENKIKIGISQGDINGIGYEVILKTLEDNRILDMCVPIVYGSPKVAAYHRKVLDLSVNLNLINSAAEANDKRANIINCNSDEIKVEISQSTEAAGTAAFQALEKAAADLKAGAIDALVTAPINKKNIQSEQFSFPGHTEYLEQTFGSKGDALMLLVSDKLRIAVATGHLPIAKVAQTLTKELIFNKIRILNESLKKDFGISRPRIAVLGLNPHSGDQGVIGKEEIEIIKPAITEALENEIICVGPLPADGFFGSDEYNKYDAILAMYHDQGLIPFKTLSMDSGVNFTAGLGVVRTSPDHGTAYDIAGQNRASENSFRQALYAAIDIVKNRRYGN